MAAMKKVLSERRVDSALDWESSPCGSVGQDTEATASGESNSPRSESTCRCRKFAIDPTCERHGRR